MLLVHSIKRVEVHHVVKVALYFTGRVSKDPSQCSVRSLLFHKSGSLSGICMDNGDVALLARRKINLKSLAKLYL